MRLVLTVSDETTSNMSLAASQIANQQFCCIINGVNMKLRHCLLSDTESETYMAQYTISYDVINKTKKLPNLTLLQIGQPSHNLNKL